MKSRKCECLLDFALKSAVSAVKSFTVLDDFEIETDWLDEECFVINFSGLEEEDRELVENIATKLLFELGQIASAILNEGRTVSDMARGEWVDYSDLNYWNDEGDDCSSDDWTTLQKEVRFDTF